MLSLRAHVQSLVGKRKSSKLSGKAKKKKDHVGIFVWVYFWILCSVPLIYGFIPPPILVFVLATSCCFWILSFLT